MKKSVLFVALIALFFVFFSLLPMVSADVNSTVANNGYACLENRTSGQCSDLTLGQQVFTSLATGLCAGYVQNSSSGSGCWPSGSCSIITTSQAMLALNSRGISVNDSANWLISKNITSPDIVWYLQIDSNKPTTCTISQASGSSTIHIGADKKISESSAGSCFTKSANGDWLQVSSSCFNEDFSVSCNESFTTTKLYQRIPSNTYPTVYVSGTSQTASPGATITDSIKNSYCFGTGGICSYESTLWASLVLNRLGYDITPYLPYLTLEASDAQNSQYIPYAFLYAITSSSDYLAKLLDEQNVVNGQKYWSYSQDSYFGTSLALLAIKSSDSTDAGNAITWLSGVQNSDGCWNNGNILNTAFILYSAFGPRNLAPSSSGVSPQICSSAGYCLSSLNCNQAGGSNLGEDYSSTCPALQICCSKDYQSPSCAEQNGVLCSSDQVCNVTSISSSDSSSLQACCPSSGSCVTPVASVATSCASLGGTCRNACLGNEGKSSGSCSLSSQVCCVQSIAPAQSPSSNLVWIILLSILIVLAVLGIIFRKKLTPLWLKIKSKLFKGKGKGHSGGPGRPGFGPRGFPPRGPPPQFQRRPMPPRPNRPGNQAQRKPKSSPEVNDVLKKLKEMGK